VSVNPTYKNLETKLRIAGLTFGQWLQLAGAVGFAIVFVAYLSPLPLEPTVSIAVFVGGLPVAASYALSGSEFSAWRLIRAVWLWYRRPRRYQAGPGSKAQGYKVDAPPQPVEPSTNGRASIADLELLWDE
jgi:hypothetical protein